MDTETVPIRHLRIVLALLVAAYVAAPAIPGAADPGISVAVVVGIALVAWRLHRQGFGASRPAVVLAGLTVLLLYSVSLGLVASSLAAWTVLPAVVAAGVALAATIGGPTERTA